MSKSIAVLVATAAIFGATAVQGQNATAQDAAAQEALVQSRWQFAVTSGTVLPTGAQRDAIRRAGLTAAQLSYSVHPAFAVTTTFGWARSRDIASAGDPKLDLFAYDVGGEVRGPQWQGGRLAFRPFAGVGAGGRSYNYRSLDVDATHNVAGYASAGGELGFRRLRIRLEARDYVTRFSPLAGAGDVDTRNDVALMVGVRFAKP